MEKSELSIGKMAVAEGSQITPKNEEKPASGTQVPEKGESGSEKNVEGQEIQKQIEVNAFIETLEKRGYTLPDEVKEKGIDNIESVLEIIEKESFSKNIRKLPKDVVDLYNYISQNKDPLEFYKEKAKAENYLELDDESFAKEYFKKHYGKSDGNPNGMDEEAINEKINGLKENGLLDVMTLEWREKERQSLKSGKSDTDVLKIQEQRIKSTIEQTSKAIDEYFEKAVKPKEELLGMKLTEDEKEAFHNFYKGLVVPDEKTGVPPLMQIINDNDSLTNLVFSLYKLKDGFGPVISIANEESKKRILESLGLTPLPEGTTKKQATDKNVVISRFASPEK